MLIDWFTVVAQIVNFLVLMALLKIFLYDRVIRAMDEREQKIASRFEQADRDRRDAEERQEKLEAEQKELDEKRQKLLDEAREAADEKKEELERKARSEVDTLRERWTDALERQKEAVARNLQEKAARQVFAAAGRLLKDLAGEDFRDSLIETFSDRIRRMDADDKQELARGLEERQPSAVVCSDAEIATAKRQQMTRLLREEIHPDLDVDYRSDGDLLGGIELRIGGRKVSWNPRQYLEQLEEEVLQALEEASRQAESTAAQNGDEEGGRDERQS